MKLVELRIDEYLKELESNAPAPGGGSASALAGAQGIALFMMVCNLTIGKEKYAEYNGFCLSTLESGQVLLNELMKAVDKDTEAFISVCDAYKLPKETTEEKTYRSTVIHDAMLKATELPFRVMTIANEGLKIVYALLDKTNKNAASDLGVAAINLNSCIKGAWLNVKINLLSLKEPENIEYYTDKGKEIYDSSEELYNKIYNCILESL